MSHPLDKPLTAKMTLKPKEVEEIINDALKARGITINGDIKCLVAIGEGGHQMDPYKVAVFQGYEMDVVVKTGKT